MIRNSFTVYACIGLLFASVPGCMVPALAQQSPSPEAQVLKAQAVPIPIAAGDLLDVSVFDAPELSLEVRVEANGTIELPLIGPTRVEGMTAQKAGEAIAHALREHHLLLNPQVNVLIQEFATQGASVTGEVQHPGVYPCSVPHPAGFDFPCRRLNQCRGFESHHSPPFRGGGKPLG